MLNDYRHYFVIKVTGKNYGACGETGKVTKIQQLVDCYRCTLWLALPKNERYKLKKG